MKPIPARHQECAGSLEATDRPAYGRHRQGDGTVRLGLPSLCSEAPCLTQEPVRTAAQALQILRPLIRLSVFCRLFLLLFFFFFPLLFDTEALVFLSLLFLFFWRPLWSSSEERGLGLGTWEGPFRFDQPPGRSQYLSRLICRLPFSQRLHH